MSDEIQKNRQIYILTEEITYGEWDGKTTETKVHGATFTYRDAVEKLIDVVMETYKTDDGEVLHFDVRSGKFTITRTEVV